MHIPLLAPESGAGGLTYEGDVTQENLRFAVDIDGNKPAYIDIDRRREAVGGAVPAALQAVPGVDPFAPAVIDVGMDGGLVVKHGPENIVVAVAVRGKGIGQVNGGALFHFHAAPGTV